MIRELRELFQRGRRTQHTEPQNIWEGNYFRELDEFIEEDNVRIREVVRTAPQHRENAENRNGFNTLRNEMLAELDRLRGIMRGDAHPTTSGTTLTNRNKDPLYAILEEMGVHVSLVKQTIFIHKKYGMFEISLNDANVYFIPSTCLRCECKCSSRKRHICIVLNETRNQGYCLVLDNNSDAGWETMGLAALDLLILSKAIALEEGLLPAHVINQIRNSFHCNFSSLCNHEMICQLRNLMLQELNQPLETLYTDQPPPIGVRPPVGARAALQNELRELFRRVRIRQEHDN